MVFFNKITIYIHNTKYTLYTKQTIDITLFQPSSSIDNNLNLQQLTPSSIANPISISPIPMSRRDSSCSTELNIESLPAPVEFADCRHEAVLDDQNTVYVN